MIVTRLLKNRMPDVPVLFLETGYHFPQTCEYRDRMTRQWVAESRQRSSRPNGRRAGIRLRHFVSQRAHPLRPITQSRTPHARARAV